MTLATADRTHDPLVLSSSVEVPLVDGRSVRSVHLDGAASAPCLASVADAVTDFLPWSASVHRGSGYASAVSTRALAAARATVASFVGARTDDTVVFTRNTTDSLNLLARSLPAGTTVLGFPSEHHANLLPWRRGRYRSLGFPTSRADAVERARAAARDAAVDGPVLLVVTGASNVTGERWPVAQIAAVARSVGARVALDGAQLAPHAPIDLDALGVDYVALSGHKLYAPFGAGVLVGRPRLAGRRRALPRRRRRRATVSADEVQWHRGSARHEAGTPNVVGAVALAAATEALEAVGWPTIVATEQRLRRSIVDGLAALPGSRAGPALARAPTVPRMRSAWCRSPSTASLRDSSRPCSAPSTASASGTVASAPTRWSTASSPTAPERCASAWAWARATTTSSVS